MKLIVLDRDGVINRDSKNFVRRAEEWQPLPGSIEAIVQLSSKGFRIAVASNQSGLGRGLFGYHELAAIHTRMLGAVAQLGGRIDGVFFCPHAPGAKCLCRKPLPGLYDEIRRYFGTSLDGVKSVGDSERDLLAARAAGADPVLVRTGNGATTERRLGADAGVPVYDDLAAFANSYLGT